MKELRDLVALWRELASKDQEAVLATVVRTQGSSYRSPGARMLLASHGQYAGSISGGCLETDLLKKGWWLTEGGKVALRRYDTTPDGEIGPEFGLGCNGIIHVLIERLRRGHAPVMDAIEEAVVHRRAVEMRHRLHPASKLGERIIQPGATAAETSAEADDWFCEQIVPPVRLLICGAGNDAVPLTDMAAALGWETVVLDGRSHYARPERFTAARHVVPGPFESDALARWIDQWTVAVIMTHSYTQDLAALRCLHSFPLSYLGVLGPRKRTEQLLEDAGLQEQELMADLFGPVGLDIGADGPEQVALAIVAEIQAVLRRRHAGSLRERPGPIHHRSSDVSPAEKAPFRSCLLPDAKPQISSTADA